MIAFLSPHRSLNRTLHRVTCMAPVSTPPRHTRWQSEHYKALCLPNFSGPATYSTLWQSSMYLFSYSFPFMLRPRFHFCILQTGAAERKNSRGWRGLRVLLGGANRRKCSNRFLKWQKAEFARKHHLVCGAKLAYVHYVTRIYFHFSSANIFEIIP